MRSAGNAGLCHRDIRHDRDKIDLVFPEGLNEPPAIVMELLQLFDDNAFHLSPIRKIIL
jgi:hypothetical protein